MSTPNPFSQPSFFPTHAIVRVIKHLLCTRGRAHGLTALLCFSGPRVRRNRRRHSRSALNEPAQDQVLGVNTRAQGWNRARLVRLARHTRQRGLARSVSRSGPEWHG